MRGSGYIDDLIVLVKVMDDVAEVATGDEHTMIIKTDGSPGLGI